MAWIYLAESGDSLSRLDHGSGQSPIVKTTDMLRPSCCRECGTDSFQLPPSGMTCKLCGATRWVTGSTLFTGDSHVRTSVLQAMGLAWQESEADFSSKWSESWKKFIPRSYFSKMSRPFELADWIKSSGHFPIFGMTVDGRVYLPQMLEPRTSENDGGCWPTPRASDGEKGGPNQRGSKGDLALPAVHKWRTPRARDGMGRGPSDPKKLLQQGHSVSLHDQVGGQLNPTWVEWLMGYPLEWTALEDWAMQWFRPARVKRSKDLEG